MTIYKAVFIHELSVFDRIRKLPQYMGSLFVCVCACVRVCVCACVHVCRQR